MGHDVEIIVKGQVVDELYITGNFWRVRDRYGGIYDFHGHTGKTVARIIKSILSWAAKDGFEPGVPDQSNPNWGWGSNEGKLMPVKEFIGVFLYIMKGFLEKAEKYPTGRWYSDQVFKITPYVDRGAEAEDTDNEENDSDGEGRNLNQDLKERLYEEYIKPIVENTKMSEAEKHFIIQHTSFQKNGDGEWVMTTTINPPTTSGWPQYIYSAENMSFVENKADYHIQVWSCKRSFRTYVEFCPQHFPHEDDFDNEKLYAWNMIPDFKFRYFTGVVGLRGR